MKSLPEIVGSSIAKQATHMLAIINCHFSGVLPRPLDHSFISRGSKNSNKNKDMHCPEEFFLRGFGWNVTICSKAMRPAVFDCLSSMNNRELGLFGKWLFMREFQKQLANKTSPSQIVDIPQRVD